MLQKIKSQDNGRSKKKVQSGPAILLILKKRQKKSQSNSLLIPAVERFGSMD